MTFVNGTNSNGILHREMTVYHFADLFWKAPELLRNPNAPIRGTQEGDIYSFAIILFEMIGRKGPYGGVNLEPKGNYPCIVCRSCSLVMCHFVNRHLPKGIAAEI